MRDWQPPGRRVPTGSSRKPDNLRSGPRMCGQALRRAVGKERLGFLAGREEMGECESRERHFSHQHNTARPGGHDQRHHDRTGGCWAGSQCKQNTLVITPPQRLERHCTSTHSVKSGRRYWCLVGMALDLSGSSWASVRDRLNQVPVSTRK